MFRDKYKSDNELITPSRELIDSLTIKMKEYDPSKEPIIRKQKIFTLKNRKTLTISLASLFVLLISISTIVSLSNGSNLSSKNDATSMDTTTIESMDRADTTMESASEDESMESKKADDDASSSLTIESEADTADQKDASNQGDASIQKYSDTVSTPLSMLELANVESIDFVISTYSNKKHIEKEADINAIITALNNTNPSDNIENSIVTEEPILTFHVLFKDESTMDIAITDSYIQVNDLWYLINNDSSQELETLYHSLDYIEEPVD